MIYLTIFGFLLLIILTFSLFSKKKSVKKKIVVVGLQNSGKSTLLGALRKNRNLMKIGNIISKLDIKIVASDSYSDEHNKITDNFISQSKHCDGIIFVIDSSDPKQFSNAKLYLNFVEQNTNNIPILILGNKVDIAGSVSYFDIVSKFDLHDLYTIDQTSKMNERPQCLVMCSHKQNFGYLPGIKWISHFI